MPEGDTVHKLARALRPLLEGESLESLWIRDRGEVRELAGRRIEEVAALGKHMLVAIGPEVALHVHLGLHGRWHRYRSGEPRQRGAGAASLQLETKAWSFVCFHAKWAELLRRGELGTHPVLGRLGPDLLAEEVDFAELLERARRRDPARAGDLLLDQTVACGLGNVFKNEVLFLEGVHPSTSPRALGAERVLALFRRGRGLLQRNLGGWPRTTTREVERGSRWPRDLPRLFVYERTGRPCLRCGTAVQFFRQGDFASPTYFCPVCQPAPEALERPVDA